MYPPTHKVLNSSFRVTDLKTIILAIIGFTHHHADYEHCEKMPFDPVLVLGPFMYHDQGALTEWDMLSSYPRMNAVDEQGGLHDVCFPSSCRMGNWDLCMFMRVACAMPDVWRIKVTVSPAQQSSSSQVTIAHLRIMVDRVQFSNQKLHVGYVAGEYELSKFLTHANMAPVSRIPDSAHGALQYMPEMPEMIDWQPSPYLMPHQKISVHMMHQVERNVRTGTHLVPEWAPVPVTSNHSISAGFMLPASDIRMNGGILANEIGSGKTAVAWELIYSSLDSSRSHRSSGTTTQPHGGTLIIIPPNLFDHWKKELNSMREDHDMNVVWLRRMPDFQKVKLSDAIEADVVVTTYSFVQNTRYTSEVFKRVKDRMCLTEKVTRVPFIFDMARGALPVNEFDWGLELLHWDRIVVDELHTSIRSKPMAKFLDCVSSRFMWGLTATPSSDPESLAKYRALLTAGASAPSHPHPLSFCTLPEFQDRCIIRLDPPNLETRVDTMRHTVPLTTLEKTLVSGASSFFSTSRSLTTHQIQLCTYFDIRKMSTEEDPTHLRTIEEALPAFKEVLDTQLCNLALRMRTLEGRQVGYDQAIAEIDARPNRDVAVFQAERHRLLNLSHHNSNILASKKETHKKLIAMRVFVESRITGRGGENDEAGCPICLEEFPETGERALFICGHSVCHQCYGIMQSNRVVVTCPICRHGVTCKDEVVIIAPSCDGDERVRKYGSKFVKVLEVLGVVPQDERVVLFTMWKSHAHVLKASLAENDISAALLMGTSHQRCLAIRSFDEGKIRVLICCIEGDAEGINLQRASHIFFTHALCGTKEEVKNMEDQCIGRIRRIGQKSNVLTVHHFITHDTPEDRVWRSAH